MKVNRKKRRPPYVPLTTFGDIAFLLIIFFVLSSVFMQEQHIEIEQATSQDVDKAQLAPVSVVLDKHGEIWLQGTPCPREALEAAVANLIQDEPERLVTLKIDKAQRQENFGEVLRALGGAGAEVLLLGEKEGKGE